MLFAERSNVYNHVGSLMVYDVTTAPGGTVRFKDILRHFEERLHVHPMFRRRTARALAPTRTPQGSPEGMPQAARGKKHAF